MVLHVMWSTAPKEGRMEVGRFGKGADGEESVGGGGDGGGERVLRSQSVYMFRPQGRHFSLMYVLGRTQRPRVSGPKVFLTAMLAAWW